MNKNILLLVQNNSFPFDKRVYREAITLKEAGNNIFVICPQSDHDKEFETIENGIQIRRYKDYTAKGGMSGYVFEYLNSIIRIYFLALKIVFKKNIEILHVANPPDFFWPLAILLKTKRIKFIYDQHDLSPEMSFVKFKKQIIKRALLLNEKLSVKFADAIIVVNNAFKKRLIDKWNVNSNKCTVIYNGPPEEFLPIKNNYLVEKYNGKKVILYIGLMTINDHIEVIVNTAKELIKNRDKKNLHFLLVGDGDVKKQMQELSIKYNIEENVEFTGIVNHTKVREYLHIADVCIAPDMPNGLNEYLTLVKVLEYMKCSKAFVAFKLKETMEFAKDAGLYARNEEDFANKIDMLIDNPQLEKKMGEKGNKIISENYLWEHSEKGLLELYTNL